MKILNLFKKSNTEVLTSEIQNIQVLDKKQLKKVIGGGDDSSVSSSSTNNVLKTKHDTVKNSVSNIR